MPKPFVKLTAEQLEELVRSFTFTRRIDAVHMHHTWRPNRAQYRGLASIEAMWEYHTQEKGWSDIAQHLSIAPDGSIWTGRNWNHAPASALGYNGNSSQGPFMFEMIGDFDEGKDPFEDPQKAAVIRVIVAVLEKFDLPAGALLFHNRMTDEKSCPGSAIDYDAFSAEVQRARGARGRRVAKTRGAAKAISPVAQEALRVLSQPGEVDMAAPEFQCDHVHGLPERGATRAARDGSLGFDPRAHLINLRDGRLSAEGAISTSEKDVKAIFQTHLPAALAEATEAGRPLRLMFFAHGGLTSEKGSLEAALRRIPWWLANGVYPIFFIWETGLLETLGQMLERKTNSLWGRVTGLFGGRRGAGDFIADHATDPAVEILARSIGGVAIWGGMKDSAERASAANTGGAWLAAQLLKGFLKTAGKHPVELHAIGHSAGSIFHAHFIEAVRQALGAAGPSFTSLHHLAPAIRVDLFKKKVRPLLGKGKGIDHLTVYTMTDEKERADTCMSVYRKSLVYLIHFGLEPEKRCPILGMQLALRGDSELKALFEPSVPGAAEVLWSPTQGGPRHSTASLSHGGFDDDVLTLNSVCRRIVGQDGIVPFPAQSRAAALESVWNEPTAEQLALGILTEHALRLQAAGGTPPPAALAPASPPAIVTRPAAGKRALCIGIDDYPDARDQLGGCVSDARNWQSFFASEGFGAELLLNEQASYEGMREAIRRLVSSARAGEVIAIQYAGHGTHLDDLNGDEDDGQDEALCCHDFRRGRVLLDDDLGELLDGAAPGVSLSLFMDCCHAGSNTRVAANFLNPLPPGTKARYVRPTAELNAAHAAFRGPQKRRASRAARGDNPYESAGEVLFAAALPTQYANEIGGSGVFTTTAMQILRNGTGALTNDAFIQAVLAAFPASFRAAQEPRLYCRTSIRPRPLLAPLS